MNALSVLRNNDLQNDDMQGKVLQADCDPMNSNGGNTTRLDQATTFAPKAAGDDAMGARGVVVNRTHRVVRERARVLQTRRSQVRSLIAPLAICSVLLALTILAIWTGLDQYRYLDPDLADVSARAAIDASNHFLVILLWFVPVSILLLSAVLYRRTHREALR